MKTKTIELYSLDELSEEAKEVAFRNFIETNDHYFLSDVLNEKLHELLEENDIIDIYGKYPSNPKHKAKVYYSLSYCQGDGAMFEGDFNWKKYQVIVKHSGHYYHSNSKIIEITYGDDIANEATEKVYAEFEEIYQEICNELKRAGYDFIEYEDSMENFEQACEANEWTFLSSGKMEN